MTGKHGGHTSVRSNGGGTPLRAGEETVASLLKRAGYATGGFGKWGCGGRGSTGVPEQHGFDVFFGYYDQVHAHSYYPPYLIRNSAEVPLPGNAGGRTGETYAHYEIMKESLAFIRDHQEEPFFCYLPVTPPHGMFDIPDDDPAWALYSDKPWPEEAKRYAAMVAMIDRNVGEVLDLLRELQLDEKTIVFFSGDNGGNDYFKSPEHRRGFYGPNVDPRSDREFRGTKGTLYEGGLRVPLIARWPGRVAAGSVSDLLCYFPDFMPTVAELCGEAAPQDTDGVSLTPELLGPEQAGHPQQQHEYLYWELGNQIAVRKDHWKAVRPKANSAWQLFDLSSDISERQDVSAEHSEVLQQLIGHAEAAHEPVEEGEFTDRTHHERDRWAKWGTSRPAPAGRRPNNKGRTVSDFSPEGLLSRRAKNPACEQRVSRQRQVLAVGVRWKTSNALAYELLQRSRSTSARIDRRPGVHGDDRGLSLSGSTGQQLERRIQGLRVLCCGFRGRVWRPSGQRPVRQEPASPRG